MARKERDVITPGGAGSLGDLLRAKGLAAAPESTPPPASPPAPPAGPEAGLAGKLVLRRTRKGRGGRTATLVEGVTGSPDALDALARRLKTALGCGVTVEDGALVVQGDQGDRLEAVLTSLGATRIVRGS